MCTPHTFFQNTYTTTKYKHKTQNKRAKEMGWRFLHLISCVHRKEGTVAFPESRVLLLVGYTGDRDCYSNRAGCYSQKWSKFYSTLQELRANKAFVIVIVIHIQIHRHKASPSWSTFQHKIWKSKSIQTDYNLQSSLNLWNQKVPGPLNLRVHNFGFPFCFIHVWGEAVIYELDTRKLSCFARKCLRFLPDFCWFISHWMDIHLGD